MPRMMAAAGVPTLEDVAKLAGVSRATVSRVVNAAPLVAEATVVAVQRAIDELGYQPNRAARALVTRRTGVVAVLVVETDYLVFRDPYFPQAYHGALQAFRESDTQVVLAMARPGEKPTEMVRYLESGHLDGAIVLSHHGPELAQAIEASRQPVVFVGNPETDGVCYVDLDNLQAARTATEHLIAGGCRKIATVTGPLDMVSGRHRLQGFVEAMTDAGLDPSWQVEGDYSGASGRRVARLLDEHPDIDGLFVANDLMAIGAVSVLRDNGLRVPDDIKLVGFDNSEAAEQVSPHLTTMTNPSDEHTRIAAEMLKELMAGVRPDPPTVVLPSELVVRESA